MHEWHEEKPPQYWIDESNLLENMNGMKVRLGFGLIGKYILALSFYLQWPAAAIRSSFFMWHKISIYSQSEQITCPHGPFKSFLNWKRQSKESNNNVSSIQKPRNCAAQRNWILKHWNEYRSFRILQCILMKTLLTSNEIRFLCCAHTHTRTLSVAFFSASFIQFICVRVRMVFFWSHTFTLQFGCIG